MCVVVTKITETRTCCAAAGESDSGGRPELRGANLHVQGGGYWSRSEQKKIIKIQLLPLSWMVSSIR